MDPRPLLVLVFLDRGREDRSVRAAAGRVLRWEPETEGARAEVPYRLRRPIAADGDAPLVVFLHGAGERGSENERQLIHFGARLEGAALDALDRAYALCPQCPEGQRWVEASWNELPPAEMTEDPSAAMAEVLALVQHTLRTEPGIDTSRVYLTGLSMGAQGSWELAARRPEGVNQPRGPAIRGRSSRRPPGPAMPAARGASTGQ